MNGRTIARVLLAVVLIGAAVGLGVTAYDAGVTAGLAQNGNVTVAPGYVGGPYVGYGWGWGIGHGLFGFVGFLLFVILLFALFRAAFGGRRRGWGGGYGHGWGPGWREGEGSPWADRAREIHDEWHRSHPGEPGSAGSSMAGAPPPAGPTNS